MARPWPCTRRAGCPQPAERSPTRPDEREASMKIVYTPISTLVPSLTPEQDAEILTAAGDDSVLVVAKTPDRQREEIVDADVLFGRVSPEIFAEARHLRYYHCLGAGVDSSLSPH